MINKICEWIHKLGIAFVELWAGKEEECNCKCCAKKAK